MSSTTHSGSDYMNLYQYLSVLNNEQIWKLRKIATGVLDIAAFSEEEIHVLEAKMLVERPNGK